MARCTLCQKGPVSGSAVSHSQIHTKRTFKPNLQKVNGLLLCTKCLKAIKKTKRVEEAQIAERAAELQKAKEEEASKE
jgi:large subunit ribosomal protein L28